MKDQAPVANDAASAQEDGLAYCCWWRSAAKFEECARLKSELVPQSLSKLTPTLKLLREMERLALVAPAGLDELRHKLFTYRSGDFWVPTGGIGKEAMDIPAVSTILLAGFHDAGKSSLVNLMYSVFGRSGLIPFPQATCGSGFDPKSWFMEEHNVLRSMRSGFCVYDTRGFDYDRVYQCTEELSEWLSEGVRHKQPCFQPGEHESEMASFPSKFARRRVTCVMVVANVSDIHKALKVGDKQPLEATKELFCSPPLKRCNENPILILTHGDKLSTEERIDSRLKICQHLGVSETSGVYDIVCLTEFGFLADESDPITAYALCEAIYRALLISDRSHLPKKNFQDWAFHCLSWLVCLLGVFFSLLGHIFSKLGQKIH
ncbi:uncharacterized protein LOC127797820 [Diospyros lotus]|uniref:uncharacterized protein LOC127797820 n=1 Tax=Diospyros lotus TaxID=55363 RepID=UPI00225B2E3D|nr:uncharacterized protein LOC127797820 [Diospyros lotus]